MVVKIDYDKCCWEDGICLSCSCGNSVPSNNLVKIVSTSSCVGCVEVCPTEALVREKRVIIYEEKCTDCGLCIDACKYGAISLD